MDSRILQIILKARDEASDTIQGVFRSNLKEAGLFAGGMLAAFGAVTKSAVDNAASYEQNRIAFESMLGSAEKARVLLKEVSDFAAKTPFELPQVVEGAQKLLAYNVAAKDVIPTFKMLGDIAAGVGTDKLPQLILAFGQVKAATKLTGMELRQFSEAGVPLLKALTDELNKNRGGLVRVSGGASLSADKIAKLNTNLAIARKQLEETNASGKAKASTLMRLNARIADYEGQLAKASSTSAGFARQTKLTEKDVLEMVSKGEIGFETVQKALSGMTVEGGKFFNLMDKQSKSFNGVMSNIRDSFGRFVREIVGINEQGDIRNGSLFAVLRDAAARFLVVLDEVRPRIVATVNALIQNRNAVVAFAGALGGLAVLAVAAFVAAFGGALVVMTAFAAAGATVAYAIANFDQLLVSLGPKLAAVTTGLFLANGAFTGLFAVIAANPIGALLVALGLLASSYVYLETQTELLKTKQELLDDANNRLKMSQDALRVSTDQLTQAREQLKDVELRLEGAALMVERAKQNLINVERRHGEASLEAKEARHQLAEAERNVERTINDARVAMQNADKAHDDFISKSREVQKAGEEVIRVKNLERTAWDGVKEAIQGAINKLDEWGARNGIKAGMPITQFLPRFAEGGWVDRTGPAVVHAGEFVLSRDMLAGRQPIPATVPVPSREVNINLGGVVVGSQADIDTLAHRLGYYLQTAGNL